MPQGIYERTPSSVTHLRNRLLAIGAETRYRQLQAELRELVRLYPALRVLELPKPVEGNGSGPAPEALAMFRQRKAKGTGKASRGPGKGPTLAMQALAILRETGEPMDAGRIARLLWDRGWRSKTSDTERKRTAAIGVTMRHAVLRKKLPGLVMHKKDKPYRYSAS